MRFLRRYQPVQVQRSRSSYGFDLSQGGTWLPLSHIGLFMSQPTGISNGHQSRKSHRRAMLKEGPVGERRRGETHPGTASSSRGVASLAMIRAG